MSSYSFHASADLFIVFCFWLPESGGITHLSDFSFKGSDLPQVIYLSLATRCFEDIVMAFLNLVLLNWTVIHVQSELKVLKRSPRHIVRIVFLLSALLLGRFRQLFTSCDSKIPWSSLSPCKPLLADECNKLVTITLYLCSFNGLFSSSIYVVHLVSVLSYNAFVAITTALCLHTKGELIVQCITLDIHRSWLILFHLGYFKKLSYF